MKDTGQWHFYNRSIDREVTYKNVLSDSLYDALKVSYKNNKELNAERENVNIAEEDLKIS